MICPSCHKSFVPKTKNQKQCCKGCTNAIFHKKHPEKQFEYSQRWYYKQPLLCHFCNKPIPLEIRKAGLRFCSEECRKAQSKLNQKKCRLKKRTLLEQYKLESGCVRCGYNLCAAALDFHHVNPKDKECGLNQCHWSPHSKKMKEELKKCILLCKNCHAEIHAGIPFNANALERVR